jgi:hypothetical protein
MLYRGRARATSASKVYNSSIDADLADGLKAFGPCWSPASETNTEAMTRSRDLRRVVHAIKHRDAAELLWAGEYCTDLIRQGDTTSGRLWRRVLERRRRLFFEHPFLGR